MKSLKLSIAALTIIFSALLANANYNPEKSQILLETEIVTENYQNSMCELVETTCPAEVSDMKMREDYNTLNKEEDSQFEFDTLNYLPEGFNAFDEDESALAEYELLNTETDEPFDFNTSDYLPVDFYVSN